MDEPLLPTTSRPEHDCIIPIGNPPLSSALLRRESASFTNLIIPNDTIVSPSSTSSSLLGYLVTLNRRRTLKYHNRSHSAPSVFTDPAQPLPNPRASKSDLKSSAYVIRQASIVLSLYAVAGIGLYLAKRTSFRAEQTNHVVDAIYYCVVTFCTIGYGDIVPSTALTKLCTCALILVGFGIFDILLNGLISGVLDSQESVMLSAVDKNDFNKMMRRYMIDSDKGRMRIRLKVGLALGVVVICIFAGTLGVHNLECLSWIDSFYLSITSVTTVGYGDFAFKTAGGRGFAIVWLLLSTFAVAKAYLYLTELRIERRNHAFAKRILHKKMTLGDLVAADLNNDGCISKSEYIIYKLKEMGKVAEKDMVQICNQFDTLDSSNCGKITMADIMSTD